MYDRILNIDNEYDDSVFLFGAKQTGKTTWLISQFPNCRYYDLLRPSEFERLLRQPELLSQELEDFGENDTVIIGEDTSKVIQLGDEVKVRIKAVDLFKRQMDFEILDDGMGKKKTKKKR